MKSYTDLEQSKKLAEILPTESADMCYKCIEDDPYDIVCKPYSSWKEEYKGLLVRGDANVIPCWSLAALLKILNETSSFIDEDASVNLSSYKTVEWYLRINNANLELVSESNPVDACYEMILKLHEQNLL